MCIVLIWCMNVKAVADQQRANRDLRLRARGSGAHLRLCTFVRISRKTGPVNAAPALPMSFLLHMPSWQ